MSDDLTMPELRAGIALQLREIERLRAQLAAAEARAERFRQERDQARAMHDAAVRLLTGIHALLYPPRFTDHDGRTWQFKSPLAEDQMQELSDRIRALPDQIAALAEGEGEP